MSQPSLINFERFYETVYHQNLKDICEQISSKSDTSLLKNWMDLRRIKKFIQPLREHRKDISNYYEMFLVSTYFEALCLENDVLNSVLLDGIIRKIKPLNHGTVFFADSRCIFDSSYLSLYEIDQRKLKDGMFELFPYFIKRSDLYRNKRMSETISLLLYKTDIIIRTLSNLQKAKCINCHKTFFKCDLKRDKCEFCTKKIESYHKQFIS
jgi:hypothetical protein